MQIPEDYLIQYRGKLPNVNILTMESCFFAGHKKSGEPGRPTAWCILNDVVSKDACAQLSTPYQ